MSTTDDTPDFETKREEKLETLYELREDLKTVAESDGPFAPNAAAALESLREAGYDV